MSKDIINREKNLDLLRVIAAIMVITQHVSAIYIFRVDNNLPGFYSVANFYMSLSIYAVPIFVMLSGAFLIDNTKNKDYKVFYKKTYRRIIIPTIVWSILYFFYNMLKTVIAYKGGENINLLKPLIDLLNGKPMNHLWYMYMIIGLYMITPLVIRIREEIESKTFFLLGVVFILAGMVISLTCELFWILWFTEYIGYFILGYSLKKRYENSKKSYYSNIFIILFGISGIFIITEILTNLGYTDNRHFYGNLSILNIIISINIYILFIKLRKVKVNVNKLAVNSFNIYLVHQGLIDVLAIIQAKITLTKFNPTWYIPIMTIIVFILSYIFSIIINKYISIFRNKQMLLKQRKKATLGV